MPMGEAVSVVEAIVIKGSINERWEFNQAKQQNDGGRSDAQSGINGRWECKGRQANKRMRQFVVPSFGLGWVKLPLNPVLSAVEKQTEANRKKA